MLGTAIVIAIPATRSSSTEGDDELTNHNLQNNKVVTKSHGKKQKRQVMFEKFQPKNCVCNKTKHQFKFKLPLMWRQNGAQTKNNLRKFSKQNQD